HLERVEGRHRLVAHASSLTTRLDRTVATGALSPSTISARVLTMVMPARWVTDSMVTPVATTSPATRGRWWVKRSSACTTLEKSTPTSGSVTTWNSACCAITTAKVVGATTSGYPSARAISG